MSNGSTGSSSATPPPKLFVHEDLSKPENRVNLALFSTLMLPKFRSWFLTRLAFPADSVLYPPQNIAGVRPDFVVVRGDAVEGWIEVELGSEDSAQMAMYRRVLREPVRCIVGQRVAARNGGLSLEEIAEMLEQISTEGLDAQQRLNVQLLLDLVGELEGRPDSSGYVEPDEGIRSQPLLAALAERFGEKLEFGVPPVRRGVVQVSTGTQKGWTIRVHSDVVDPERSVSVAWNPAAGGGLVRVPSAVRLIRCLRPGTASVREYADFIREISGRDIEELDERRSHPVDEDALLSSIDEFVEALKALAET